MKQKARFKNQRSAKYFTKRYLVNLNYKKYFNVKDLRILEC